MYSRQIIMQVHYNSWRLAHFCAFPCLQLSINQLLANHAKDEKKLLEQHGNDLVRHIQNNKTRVRYKINSHKYECLSFVGTKFIMSERREEACK